MSKVNFKEQGIRWKEFSDYGDYQPDYPIATLINVEASNTIIQQSTIVKDLYAVEALTQFGWLRTPGINIDDGERDRIIQKIHQYRADDQQSDFRKPRATKIRSFGSVGKVHVTENVNEIEVDEITESSSVQWGESADVMLQHLENSATTDADRDRTVLFVGPMAFSEPQRPRLLAALATYIDENRFTRDDDRAIVVGSAARKYAMNMGETDFESYAKWLLPQQTTYLSECVELEFVKGVCWRLTFVPVQRNHEFPQLTQTLFQIFGQYTNSRVLLQKNFDVIALNAIVSVFVLDTLNGTSELATAVWSQVQSANVIWFAELVFDRLKESAESISHHDITLGAALGKLIDDRCALRANA